MANKIPFCCPEPAIKNALHPHPIPTSGSSVTSANTQMVTLCTPDGDKVFVQFDTSTIVPVALGAIYPNGEKYTGDLTALVDCDAAAQEIELEGQDCAGESLPATGKPGELVQVVQAPGQVLTVRICEDDRDFELSCGIDPETGHQVQTAYRIVNGEFELIKRWDTVTGLEWTGDPATLEGCGGKPLESEQELFCDAGTEFFRWYVIEDGEPTGQYIDTDFAGAPYTVTDEAGIKRGACVAESENSVSSVTGNDLSGLEPGTSFAVYKNECCSLKLTTSIGTIIIPKTATAYSTQIFKTAFTIDAVEVVDGTCDLATVTIISNLSV